DAAMLPPQPTGYSVVDASSWLFDQVSLIWGTLSYKNMMDPNNSSDPQHLAYHSVFDGDPFPADMSQTGMPGPFDLMMGASKVIFQNLLAMHFNSDAGTFVDTAELDGGSVVRGNDISTINAGYALVILKLFVEEFAGTPLETMAKEALVAQANFLLNSLQDANGGFYNTYTIGTGAADDAKTALAQAGAIRGLYAAYQATNDAAYLTAADNGYDYLVQNFYDADEYGFHTTQGVGQATYTPKIVAALSGALREARLVGNHEEATLIYVNFWDTVANRMQLAEADLTGEVGGDSDGDGIPFIPEQPDGLAPVFAAEAVQLLSGVTSVGDELITGLNPTAYQLDQNYPNPFNPTTEIQFSLPEAGKVVLEVYNVLGKKAATLVDGQMNAGVHSITFDAGQLPTGLYFYKITTSGFSAMKKMSLLK
ncbi:MAG TPA: T9SS type A sorting domain-containing protein, partial [bacterium]|nr:T9SS type A sorting domain-containing protein [bacterium]